MAGLAGGLAAVAHLQPVGTIRSVRSLRRTRLARTLTEAGRPERAAMFAGAPRARFRSAETGTRTLGIDREDHGDQLTMFDVGLTMDVGELVALIDEWLTELTDAAS